MWRGAEEAAADSERIGGELQDLLDASLQQAELALQEELRRRERELSNLQACHRGARAGYMHMQNTCRAHAEHMQGTMRDASQICECS